MIRRHIQVWARAPPRLASLGLTVVRSMTDSKTPPVGRIDLNRHTNQTTLSHKKVHKLTINLRIDAKHPCVTLPGL